MGMLRERSDAAGSDQALGLVERTEDHLDRHRSWRHEYVAIHAG